MVDDESSETGASETADSGSPAIVAAVAAPLKPVLRAALSPAAEVLGEALKRRVSDWVLASENENVRAHITDVLDELAREDAEASQVDGMSAHSQLSLFQDWTEGAKRASPDDLEISEMWRALLKELLQGKPLHRVLVESLKRLSPEEARLLLSISVRCRDPPPVVVPVPMLARGPAPAGAKRKPGQATASLRVPVVGSRARYAAGTCCTPAAIARSAPSLP